MKKLHSIRPLLFLLTTVLFVSGCLPDPQSDLDTLLEQALYDASQGEGRDHYQMPTDGNYGSIPADPRNPVTREKVELGKMLFHETALGVQSKHADGMGTYSCASCHHVQAGFTAGRQQGIGDGGLGFGVNGESRRNNFAYSMDSIDVQQIRSPTALNVAYQTISLWNGQFGAGGVNSGTESNWVYGKPTETNHLGYQGPETQAIAGLKVHRSEVGPDLVQRVPAYQAMFDRAFPNVPASERISTEYAGLAIAAYERSLLPNQSPFQKWLRGDVYAMNEQEKSGAIIFFGKANCGSCHKGPALASDEFHALGMSGLTGPHVIGSDPTHEAHLGRGAFTKRPEDDYRFKVPQLYNLREMGFFGHGSTFTSIESVVRYKNAGQPQDRNVPRSQLAAEFQPLNLDEQEVRDLTRFLESALYDNNLQRFVPSSIPSGNCFPNADPISRADLGCG